MKKAKRNLLVSVVVLLLTAALATASTFAWFTINKDVNVPDMDINVTSGSQGLYISIDGKNYKSSLNAQDWLDLTNLKSEDGKTLLNVTDKTADMKLDAVSSADGMDFTDIATNPINALASKKFIDFKLYFRATGEEAPTIDMKNLTLAPKDGTTPLTEQNKWKPITAIDYGKTAKPETIALGELISTRAAYAARMSFESIAFDKTTKTTRVWDPYVGDPNTFCGKPNDANGGKYDNTIGNLALDYYNGTVGVGNELTMPTIAGVEDKATFSKNVLNLTKNDTTAFFEGTLQVRLWLEGFDGDCFNSILNDGLTTTLCFTVRTVAQP